jgi:enediyne biosynthesis protein E4
VNQSPNGRPRQARLGRRRRRLYTTAVALAALCAVGLWVGLRARRDQAPAGYVPGEENDAITRRLDLGIPAEAPDPVFTDVTEESGLGAFRAFAGERSTQLPEDMGGGVAWGDIDSDGDEDIALISAGAALPATAGDRAPSRIYVNNGDGTFSPAPAAPDMRIVGMGAAWGDFDGDGDLDLVVTGFNVVRLYKNEDGALLRDDSLPEVEGFAAGAAWGDYDADGDLDLYICRYVAYRPREGDSPSAAEQYGTEVPFTLNPSSFAPQSNLLFRNDGDAGFVDVAEALGVSNPTGRSLCALWHDFDDDGLLDLYVANDISDNAFYHNTGDGFEDISHPAFVADYRGAMGLAAADWNDDGDDDLFITHWVAQENALYDSLLADLGPPPDGAPPVRFMDAADIVGLGQVALQRVGWGTAFADFDHDGRQDLVVANGSTFQTSAQTSAAEDGSAPMTLRPQASFLFWNRDGEAFHDLTPIAPAFAEPHVSRGLAVCDYDNDGDMDVALVDLDGGVRLLRNDIEKRGAWVKLRLRARPGGRAVAGGTGASLTVYAGGVARRRAISSGSYLSQNSLTAHVGVGNAATIDRVEVRWRRGVTETYTGVAPNAEWLLVEGEAAPTRRGPPSRPGSAEAPALSARETTTRFWASHRAAMDALKIDSHYGAAIPLFREALSYDPEHEDAIYYLGSSLVAVGETDAGLAQFDRLIRLNPLSHRALKRWGVVRATTARSTRDVEDARAMLLRALDVNQEETGALLALGEVALLSGDYAEAERQLALVCQANEQSVAGFFLRGFIAWRQEQAPATRALLGIAAEARAAGGLPGSQLMEGSVTTAMHTDETPLSAFTGAWGGELDPRKAYTPLDVHLRAFGARLAHDD